MINAKTNTHTVLVLGPSELEGFFYHHPSLAEKSRIIALSIDVLELALIKGWKNVFFPDWIQNFSSFSKVIEEAIFDEIKTHEKKYSENRLIFGCDDLSAWNLYYNCELLNVSKASFDLGCVIAANIADHSNLLILSPSTPADYYFDSFFQPAIIKHALRLEGVSAAIILVDNPSPIFTYKSDAYNNLPDLWSDSISKKWDSIKQPKIIVSAAAVSRKNDVARLEGYLNNMQTNEIIFCYPQPFWNSFPMSELFSNGITIQSALDKFSVREKNLIHEFIVNSTYLTKFLYCNHINLDSKEVAPWFEKQMEWMSKRYLFQLLTFLGMKRLSNISPVDSLVLSIIDGGVNGPLNSSINSANNNTVIVPHSQVINFPTDSKCLLFTEWWQPSESRSIWGDLNKSIYTNDYFPLFDHSHLSSRPLNKILIIYNGIQESAASSLSFSVLRSVVEWLIFFSKNNSIELIHRLKPGDQTPINAYCDLLSLDFDECQYNLQSSLEDCLLDASLVVSIGDPSSALWTAAAYGCGVLLISDQELSVRSLIDNNIINPVTFDDAKKIMTEWIVCPDIFNLFRTEQIAKYSNTKNKRLSYLSASPNDLILLNNSGLLLISQGRNYEALDKFQAALLIEPNNPVVLNSCGVCFFSLQSFKDAINCYKKAIDLDPRYLEAHNNLGNALVRLFQHEVALQSYDQALALDPGYVEAYWNKALALLQLGRFSEGWVLHESRWAKPSFQPIVRHFSQPIWDGSFSVNGKTLLLHAEQGLGDTLQFVRYVELVKTLGARVVLEVQAPLVSLFDGLFDVESLVKQGDSLPPFDCHCPLMSLPLAFQTTLFSVPNAVPYLKPSSEKERFWAEKLGATTQLRVGLVWSGDPRHQNDKQRSIALSELMAALPPGFEYVSLQSEIRDSDRRALKENERLVHFGSELKDFSDTAALCAQMDVVVCVDTSVAHLSGALGKPTFLLLPYNPDWRWLLDRTDSPWYPTMQLYRQEQLGSWQGALEKVSADLLGLEQRRFQIT